MEILQDIHQLPYQINRFKGAWRAIEEQLEYFTNHWPELCQKHLFEAAAIKKADSSFWAVEGNALGKPFHVRATPLVIEVDDGPKIFAELVISTPSIKTDELVERSRLLMDRNTVFYSESGDVLLQDHDDLASYKLLTSIINLVLRTQAS